MKILKNKFLISLLFISSSVANNSNFISYNGYSPYNIKYIMEMENLNNTNSDEKKSVFDIKQISSMYINDVTNPKISDDLNEFNFDSSPLCLSIVKSKYSCITLKSKDFNSFCERLNSDECSIFTDNDTKIISELCKINLIEATDFVKTINNLINYKQFFCVKKDEKKIIATGNNNNENDENKVNIDNKTEKSNSKKEKNDNDYCPITISLQKGYLQLIAEGEELEMNIKRRKRTPVISNINSFLPSRSIDAQITKKKLVEDFKKNCNYTLCRKKLNEYIMNIREEYSYFNVIYQYKVNDDSLRDNIIDILKEINCSASSSSINPYFKIVLTPIKVKTKSKEKRKRLNAII
ncbi:hypothetical protein BCR36DRAFT_408037 [Piromyces finnis]|uniref:Uncharacterized protein n=1 Tax=Piromyces finnis TaxID=1754191 RepID=A0A1Y1VNR6_9FUNG|nr:hypothetical protein BCR36DRAFT_408037 [Piromyces finnis]|eukprot:ORX61057.1 hypothetical protein BCR36DRAFT_408037 [Piromyces finnis]